MERRWARFILIMVFCVRSRHETWPNILFYCIWFCFKRTGFWFLDCFVVNSGRTDHKDSFRGHGWDSPISFIVAETEFHETEINQSTHGLFEMARKMWCEHDERKTETPQREWFTAKLYRFSMNNEHVSSEMIHGLGLGHVDIFFSSMECTVPAECGFEGNDFES